MRIGKRILSIIVISLLTVSSLSIFWGYLFKVSAGGLGSLTGTIYDSGVDTDTDGTFDFLQVGIEINVSISGIFQVEVSGLYDSAYNYISVWNQNSTYLDVGLQVVYVSLDGPSIFASGFDPISVSGIDLYDEYYSWLDYLSDVPLSRPYTYTEFDIPPASLTGTIYDSGVDTDSDGTFDYLEVGVEINVSISGIFQVEVSGLYDSAYNYISVSDQNSTYLDVGLQVVYVSLDGPSIFASGFDPISVSGIDLYDEYYSWLDYLSDVPLSRPYTYTEFDIPPASLTGTIYDSGVDTDSDGTFDYLEVGVEINVSTAGTFWVVVADLFDSAYDYIWVMDANSTYLDVGIQVVYRSLDGPTIYASGLNPVSVSNIILHDEYLNVFDSLSDVPLSREYSYSEFDSPPAQCTIVGDRGVDIDGDGAFDYLEVDVEVNVTDSGNYEIAIQSLLDSDQNYIDVSSNKSEYLDAGVNVVNVWLYGPTIYVSGLNPVNVSEIKLFSVDYVLPFEQMRHWVGSAYDISLSREYLYTEFDSPFADIEAIFVVHPDGLVVMGGALDYAHMVPPNTGPSVYGVASIEESGALTLVSADFALTVPPEEASQFPFNSSAFTLLSEYSGGLLTTTISGSTILPPSIASEFPFNVTDFTVMGEYVGDIVTGNATVDILSGFPLEDIEMSFQGNNTYVYVSGSTTVVFGNYLDIGEINATVLDGLLQQLNSTIPGQGPDSLYNMTQGLFECTRLNTATTPYDAIGATVDFEAEFQGDLIQAFVNMSGQPPYMNEVWNAAWASVESGSFVLTYSRALKEADMDLVLVNNMTHLIDNMIQILPDILSPEEAEFIESILNTTYCTVDSAQVSLDYEFGQATLTATATIQDLNAELNYVKNMFLTYIEQPPWTSQLQTLNETQIDLTDFRMSLNITETTMEAEVSGFAVIPPLDWTNATNFKLERFFNITASEDQPPREGERLKVTVEGGSNATHTVRILRPVTVPEPDISAPGGMIWNNQSISELTDLIFQIGPTDDVPPVIGTPVHTPEIPDDDEDVTVSVNVTDADTGVNPDGVTLSYSTDDGETWKNVTMSKTTGDTYEGTIPGLQAGTQVKYMITAYDYAGNQAAENNAGQYYVYTVIQEFPTWQTVIVTLLLIGIIIIVMKRRRKIAGNSMTTNQLLSIFVRNSLFR